MLVASMSRAARVGASSSRLTLFDALRGLAVFGMIHQHVGIWLWRGPDPGQSRLDYPFLIAFNSFVVFLLPVLFALSGLGAAMMCRRADRPGLDGQLVRRGLVLYAFGIAVNLATPSWFSWGSFFALHLMGAGIALSPIWRRLSDRGLWIVAAVCLAALPLLERALDIPAELTNPEMRDTSLPGGALRLAIVGSQYSIVPWMSAFVLGFWAGRAVMAGRLRQIVQVGAVVFAIGALGFLGVVVTGAEEPSLLWTAFRLQLGWFPPSIAIVALLLGPALAILAGAAKLQPRWNLADDHPLVTLGRISLTVFIVHAPLFRELSRPLGIWSALGPGATMAVVLGFTAVAILASQAWARVDYRYGAEWWMRVIADRFARAGAP